MSERSARYIHSELMAEHGGLSGLSREGALEAALARPQYLYHHSDQAPSLERLAAAYGFAIGRGHCFPDGNKRLSLALIDVFLRLNGRQLLAEEANASITLRAVAAGEMDEEQLTAWVSENSAPL